MAIRLHKFESARVAGSGSSRTSIDDVLWRRGEFIEDVGLEPDEIQTFDALLETLQRHNRLMIMPGAPEGESRFLSRTAETVRLLGHTYEYWHRGRPSIDATRWEVVEKVIPDRKFTSKQFVTTVHAALNDALGHRAEHVPMLFKAVEEVVSGVSQHLAGDVAKARWSDFQMTAVADAVVEAAKEDLGIPRTRRPGRMLVAGVGSGKTFAFMLPRLILVKRDLLEGRSEKSAHLMLYPRSALAIDQFGSSLEAYAVAAGIPIEDVHSEMGSFLKQRYDGVGKGIQQVHGKSNPRLILSSLETLQRRMLHPLFSKNVLPRLASVTIDEVHLISGVTGAQVALLLRRIRALSPQGVQWTGASATIASPQEHLSRLVGLDVSSVSVVEPREEDMICDGVVHHVFIRPSGLVSTQGALVNATSMLIHARRDGLDERPRTREQRLRSPKTIGFADNLETLGVWNEDFRENERTSEFTLGGGQRRYHPNAEDQATWSAVQREMPYAVRFHAPLQRRLEASGGRLPAQFGGGEALELVREEWKDSNICTRCKQGEEVVLGEATREEMNKLGVVVHRGPHHEEDDFIPFRVRHPIFDTACEIGSHHRCPFLIAGACTWFSTKGAEVVKRLGNATGNVKHEYANQATSRVQSSKSKESDEADDLTDAVFRGSIEELYGIRNADGEDAVDLVLASPSLEVGVDLPNLEESILTQAIRNIASYRQKVGRAGRESLSEALNVVMARDSANDLHYYRQPRKLIDKGRLDPVPLKERNAAVGKSAAYMAVWDFLVFQSTVPEDLRAMWGRHGNGGPAPGQLLETCALLLREGREDIRSHLRRVLVDPHAADEPWFDDLLAQVMSEIDLLLSTNSGCTAEGGLGEAPRVVDLLAFFRQSGRWGNMGGNERIYIPPTVSLPTDVVELVEELEQLKQGVGERKTAANDCVPIARGINEEIDALQAGAHFDAGRFDRLIDTIDTLADHHPDCKRVLRRLREVIEDIQEITGRIEASGVDPSALRLVMDYHGALTDERSGSTYYLQDVLKSFSSFHVLRTDPWFLSPRALYLHPHSEEVKLATTAGIGLQSNQNTILLEEALHSFIPGMWSRRMPQALYKVNVGTTVPVLENDTLLRASLNQMEDQGVKVERLGRIETPPPGRTNGMLVVKPTELKLTPAEDRSYIKKADEGAEILDGDEGSPEGRGTDTIRVPRSFSERWVKAVPNEQWPVLAHLPLQADEELVLSPHGGEGDVIDTSTVAHPFAAGAFASVQRSSASEITEFVYGLTRTVPNDGGGSQLRYQTEAGRDVAFGYTIRTDGIRFELNDTVVKQVISKMLDDINQGDIRTLPSMLKWMRVRIADVSEEQGAGLSNFGIKDAVAGFIAAWNDEGRPMLTPELIRDLAGRIMSDQGRLHELAIRRYDARNEVPDVEGLRERADHEQRERRIRAILVNMTRGLRAMAEGGEGEQEHLERWIHRSLLMSLGVTLVTASQRLSGASDRELAFALPDAAWDAREATVLLYDRAEQGNGNVEVIERFFHIPNLVRSSHEALPSHDFLTLLEEVLLPCAQHHTDLLALRFIETDGARDHVHESLLDLSDGAESSWRDMKSTWAALGIEGTWNAPHLPALHAIRAELAFEHDDVHVDDVTRATGTCWNGCPECIARLDLVQGGFVGLEHIDRLLLDRWYAAVRAARPEYHSFHPRELCDGTAALSLGSIQNLAIRSEHGTVRSCLLPWTIGVEMSTEANELEPRIILRENDVTNDRDVRAEGIVVGTPARGVRRLLWFNLLMTAYLDLRGDIPAERRDISLVFYDARDLSFEDIGLAPQMMEALRSAARADGFESFHKLSDVLGWLVLRGFRVTVCLDAAVIRRDQNAAVRNFLRNLRRRGGEDIHLLERRVLDDDARAGSMHKKVLITPFFLLMGSSNLTRSGAGRNEEIQAHVQYGHPAFEDVLISCRDTLTGATPVPPEAYRQP